MCWYRYMTMNESLEGYCEGTDQTGAVLFVLNEIAKRSIREAFLFLEKIEKIPVMSYKKLMEQSVYSNFGLYNMESEDDTKWTLNLMRKILTADTDLDKFIKPTLDEKFEEYGVEELKRIRTQNCGMHADLMKTKDFKELPEGEYQNMYVKAVCLTHGNAESQYTIGNTILAGKMGPVDAEKAVEFFKAAAEKRHLGAAIKLAELYDQGKEVQRDRELATYYYEMATLYAEKPSFRHQEL